MIVTVIVIIIAVIIIIIMIVVILLTDEIGAPEPQLEPQMTSLDKCKTKQSIP